MNDEWRPPNWFDGFYPDPNDKQVTNEQWAWEFLRRNEKYVEEYYAASAKPFPLEDTEAWQEYYGLCQRYMLERLYPPNANPNDVHFHSDYFLECNAFGYEGPSIQSEDPSQVVIKFILDGSLGKQIDWAKRFLKSQRNSHTQDGLIQPQSDDRIRKGAYQKFLRVLDGRKQRVAWQQLGNVLCPDSYNPKDRAKELLEEAQTLVKWKYKILLNPSLTTTEPSNSEIGK